MIGDYLQATDQIVDAQGALIVLYAFVPVLGVENLCVIRSLDMLRKRGHGMLDDLQRAFNGDTVRLAA